MRGAAGLSFPEPDVDATFIVTGVAPGKTGHHIHPAKITGDQRPAQHLFLACRALSQTYGIDRHTEAVVALGTG